MSENWQQVLRNLNTWKRGSRRAVHKPLLVLLAIGRAEAGRSNVFRFRDLAGRLAELLREFGPPRKTQHPENPFWHLQGDGIWHLDHAERFAPAKPGRSPSRGTLLEHDACGHVSEELWRTLSKDPLARQGLAATILQEFWPETYHGSLRAAIGLPEESGSSASRRKRDPRFREVVLRAYRRRCAVCGHDLRIGERLLGLEAAHVHWHSSRGPDEVANGLALCSLHHIALDLGAIGLDDERRLLVSSDLSGGERRVELLLRYEGRPIEKPQPGFAGPALEHIGWHRREVFRGPAREAYRQDPPGIRVAEEPLDPDA